MRVCTHSPCTWIINIKPQKTVITYRSSQEVEAGVYHEFKDSLSYTEILSPKGLGVWLRGRELCICPWDLAFTPQTKQTLQRPAGPEALPGIISTTCKIMAVVGDFSPRRAIFRNATDCISTNAPPPCRPLPAVSSRWVPTHLTERSSHGDGASQ